jgi:dimethylhistidine N-methyltransferase
MNGASHIPAMQAETYDFHSAVRDGLRRKPKSIPPKFFYDAQGSRLFDLICTTPEYYPTRTETAILERHGAEMAETIGRSCTLIELGSGSATKTPLLLKHLHDDAAYVPVDICEPHLLDSTRRLRTMFPALEMQPLCADYHRLPAHAIRRHASRRPALFFPGSTIGNSTPDEAVRLLRSLAALTGPGSALLIGVDCKKAPDLLNAAYNDAAGHTAAFNRNLLHRMRRELGARLDAEQFDHHAYYNAAQSRVEMHLISRRPQAIRVGGETFAFDAGESIHTENSYKYDAPEFRRLARAAGWRLNATWRDADGLFDVHHLRAG